ncbi:MAG: DUF3365 domain-containing protein [Gammaproteobacteria bacterium]|nr:DUF3365 domain-containing protein [Gammaproteobacteria bacterium]MCW8987971.1 DUF3365 domain-containing protein [Gammaproteobacteria bacterium]
MKKHVFFTLVLSGSLIGSIQAGDMPALKVEAKGIIMGFGKELKDTLMAAKKSGGATAAVKACNDKAPGIASSASKNGWEVARTSLKLRNEKNAPDEWELKVLKQFETRKAKGENPKDIAYAEIIKDNGKKTFRMMKAIPTGELCITCHGAKVKPEIVNTLNKYYPNDKAKGFKIGDIRGAFTLKKAL